MAAIMRKIRWRMRLAQVMLFALAAMLAASVAAVQQPKRILTPQRAAQIIRTSVSIDTTPQPEAIEGQPLRFTVRINRALRERTLVSFRIDNLPNPALRRALPTIAIEAGQLSAEIIVPTVDDDLLNGDRTIAVMLVGLSGNAQLGNAQAIGVIRDNERPPVPTADIEAEPLASIVEGGTLAFTVRLRAAVQERTMIRYSIIDPNGAAQAAGDARAIVPAGSTDIRLNIATRDDAIVNGQRVVEVRLTAISGNGRIGVARAVGVVLDNDQPPPTQGPGPVGQKDALPPAEPEIAQPAEQSMMPPGRAVAAILATLLLLVAAALAIRRIILPRFYKVGWTIGAPQEISAASSGSAIPAIPHGGVEIVLGPCDVAIVGPCPILSEEERDDPDP